MYDHASQKGDPTITETDHHAARTAVAIAACLNALAEEADQVGLNAVATFIEAAAHLAQEEARSLQPAGPQLFGRPSLVWTAPEPETV